MKSQTLHSIQSLKNNQQPIAVLTAYDSSFAKLLSENGVEIILIGDSLGMVIQGQQTTVPVTLEQMCYHTRCVAAGNNGALLVADLPYMSYATEAQAIENSAALMQAGANMVKLEGGEWLLSTIKKLSERGIPVCTHLGLTPQSVDALGGFKVQGREEQQAQQMINDAIELEKAGAKLLVLECVPQKLAKEISQKLTIPTIGIGAGKETDGQVLVLHDMLGLNDSFRPKFVKNFMHDDSVHSIADAIKNYVEQVKNKTFPGSEHSFD
ncbi:3-methyl-2-oxobutanoate hydroxymethyltransferase [Aliikangiella coralliicola]|uniref:3-methyl-2-oxobutanoate hydroxymethyltransferase n=1 Tax=Aliikangiella coralliicola TaxID=2592383 RepID=A0A545UEE5_9GAMM|nr:3-methyl-2-oxobutanoate hydroxymethyltransferase [Aliikangiella coralliicola]TQV87847.1 3-methyl-2-oxobutanoate hydroxymethyltransferase [Aliikangiella coralliicola]